MNAGHPTPLTAIIRKTVLLLLLAVFGAAAAQAQVRLGLLGGLHSSKVLETNSVPGWDTTTKPFNQSRSGFQLGIILEIPVGHSGWFFQPQMTYISKGRKYNKNYDSATALATDTIYNKSTLTLNYIEIPLNMTYKMPMSRNRKSFFFLSAGPYVSFIYSGNIKAESLTSTNQTYSNESTPVTVGKATNAYNTIDLGLDAKAGFEIGNVMLNAYWSRGLSNFYNADYNGTFHHEVIGANLGIWLSSTTQPPLPAKKKDTDKDGVPDNEDLCPFIPGKAAWHGCPVPDTDHDGIDDEHDSCKTIAGVARYNGCPIPDTDGDGIDDEHDSCKTIKGVGRYNGCPIPDRDGDGVNDEEDQCPDTPGVVENKGCPVVKEIKKETTDQINYIAHNILFNPSSDHLTDSSSKALDDLAALLKDHPEWHLTIEGYTDNSGTPDKNLVLSQKRADAVKRHLVEKGIGEEHLTAIGYGQANPIADNKTAKGKAANRRVELKLSIEKH